MKALVIRDGGGEKLNFDGEIELTVVIPSSASNGSLVVFEDIVAPGAGPARHIHKAQDEVFFVLEGEFDFEIAGELRHAGAGDIAFVPRGAIHAFKNVDCAPGRLRYMFTPAGSVEQMFQEFHRAGKDGPLNQDIMSEIALRHGQEFVGPPL